MRFYSFIFIACTALTACNLFQKKEDKQPIARVGVEYLYLEDLDNLTSEESEEDSAKKVQAYVDSWIKEQLLLRKALLNLTEEQSDFEKQLRNYKNSLLIYAFENQLINQKLDTLISSKEYLDYYNNNKPNFKLKQDIVNAKFVQFLNSAPEQDSLNYWISRSSSEAKIYLSEYCTQFALSCHLDTSTWISFTKIKELSQLPNDKNLYLSKGKNEVRDSTQTIFLEVYDLKSKGAVAPFSYIKEQIKSIIINKRKTQLISKVKKEIFEEATLKEQYEIFK